MKGVLSMSMPAMSVTATGVGAMPSRSHKLVELGKLDEARAEILTLHDQSMLRASTLTGLLRRGGSVFSTSEGSVVSYSSSEVVEGIDIFVSHNWVIPRPTKFLTLSLNFNYYSAVVVTGLYVLLLAALGLLGLVPVLTQDGKAKPFMAKLTCMPLFALVLLSCRDVLWLCGHRGKRCFLDKTCISQTDDLQKAMGIKKLGAFIRHSKRMVVIYSGQYFRKLWTVYEVAAFLSLHPMSDMQVLAVPQAVCLAVGLCMCYLSQLLMFGMSFAMHDETRASQATAVILGLFYSAAVRRWSQEKRRILIRLSSFEVRKCECFCEDDRPLVYKNISALMEACDEVPDGGGQDMALDAFDQLVRTEVLERFVAAFGFWAFQVKHYLLFGLVIAGARLVDECANFGFGDSSLREFGADAGYLVVWWGFYGLLPLGFEAAMHRCLDLTGVRNTLFVVVGACFVFALGMVCSVVTQRLSAAIAEGSTVAVYLMIAEFVIVLALFFWQTLCRAPRFLPGEARLSQTALRQLTLVLEESATASAAAASVAAPAIRVLASAEHRELDAQPCLAPDAGPLEPELEFRGAEDLSRQIV